MRISLDRTVEFLVTFIAFAFPLKFFFDAILGIVGWKNPILIASVITGFIFAVRRGK
jgi:hypothetical protein